MAGALDGFAPATKEWFEDAFLQPTPAQVGAWQGIRSGGHVLVVAPTGSGKTLAAFLSGIDRLMTSPRPDAKGTRVLYISPLKALAVDVERNLRSPLVGITQTAARRGETLSPVTVGVRSGDTPQAERRNLISKPPDVLITTPESLFLMLTSATKETLRSVDTVIIDEIHAVAGTKRGSHLALSLERLDDLLEQPAQRIGLSATVRPHEEVARFLGGSAPVRIVDPPSEKTIVLSVVVPIDDMTEIAAGSQSGGGRVTEGRVTEGSTAHSINESAQGSIWPHVEQDILEQVLQRRSSIIFANSRGLAEKLTARLNELYADRNGDGDESPPTRSPAQFSGASGETTGALQVLAKAHHGSVSKEQRSIIEDELKTGRLRCVVATSSLELGIDMGLVDLVIQVSTPPSVASGLQRVGRAGHQVGEVSYGVIYPKTRQDLLGATVTAERMQAGQIELLSVPRNPLDILAQQTIAAAALDELDVETWFETVRRCAPFATLPRSAFDATLDLLAGRYPSDQFAELRPRVVWDREAGTLTGRPGAQRLAVTSGGTIPDRGMFAVTLAEGSDQAGGSRRVGELDEEMVYETRINDVFALGATSWRVQEITHDRVIVTPAYGQPGRLPFWRGDGIGRPAELGEAIGAFVRTMTGASEADARERAGRAGLDDKAVDNLLAFLSDQQLATGHVPSDKTLVLERFRDELGDWRLVLHSPYGRRVHAPWALAVGTRIAERYGIDGSVVDGDDGIVARIPDTEAEPPGAELFLFEPDELDRLVTQQVGGSALFAARFRECAARALLLPRLNPGKRAPLWQQRQRSSQLLEVARNYADFPIILEAARECLQDVYDLPALSALTRRIEGREIQVVEVTTEHASPFAQSLLFGYVAAFLYEGDTPLAERRASALALDSTLLSELLGRVELRELLDPDVITRNDLELQRLADDRKAKGPEGVADLLRILGPLTAAETAGRTIAVSVAEAEDWLRQLTDARRALALVIAGETRWCAIEDAARLRDALGVALPHGVPDAFLEPVPDPLADLLSRYARTHGPFTTAEAAARFGLGTAVVADQLRRLAHDGRLVEGEFRPQATGSEWVELGVLRRLRSRSLAAVRKQVEPVEPAAFAHFLPVWQGVGGSGRGSDGVLAAVEQLAGVPLPASAWETLILPARVRGYSPAMLDELTTSGEVLWSGGGVLPGNDGWIRLHTADLAPLVLSLETPEPTDLEGQILSGLAGGGAFFFRQLSDAVGSLDDTALIGALWDLVWAGRVTNDTLAPLRTLIGSRGSHRSAGATPRSRSYRGRRPPRLTQVTRTGPPTVAGRWSLLPEPERDPTTRALAQAETLLDRYGVVTRGSVVAEGIPGGFASVYRVLREMEQSGRSLRGYFVETLGGAQFTAAATVDRLRTFAKTDDSPQIGEAVTLAATDPANPFGAALPWPDLPPAADGSPQGHRPGRKSGAIVVTCEGRLILYVERGGKTALAFDLDRAQLDAAARSLAHTLQTRRLGRMTIEKVNGRSVNGTPFAEALLAAGFSPVPRGVRLSA
ncbi:MAG: ATP-dependent helicase [Actinomycetota bacterium]|nr:ATP-dependent helicase [Actinomycetota bacterium]